MSDPHALSSDDLLGLVEGRRWFAGKERTPETAEVVGVPYADDVVALAIVEVSYRAGTHEHYLVALAAGDAPPEDAFEEPAVATRLARAAGVAVDGATVRPMGVEQSNSSVAVDELHVVKLYRRLEAGVNPELELLRALADQGFANAPRLEGALETDGPPVEAALVSVTSFVPAAGGWELALETLAEGDARWLPERAWRLGEVTAAMHDALAANDDDPHLAPEEPSAEAVSLLAAAVDEEIAAAFAALPDDDALGAVAHRAEDLRDLAQELGASGPSGLAIRTHGDYHLGQVLWAEADDWVVIDFEGEPGRSLAERRRKRSGLRDVAGMTRSFAYAADASLLLHGVAPPPGWVDACRDAFVEGYATTVDERLLPPSRRGLERLLALFELEKLVYELRYEARNRPDWASIPIAGMLRLLETG